MYADVTAESGSYSLEMIESLFFVLKNPSVEGFFKFMNAPGFQTFLRLMIIVWRKKFWNDTT